MAKSNYPPPHWLNGSPAPYSQGNLACRELQERLPPATFPVSDDSLSLPPPSPLQKHGHSTSCVRPRTSTKGPWAPRPNNYNEEGNGGDHALTLQAARCHPYCKDQGEDNSSGNRPLCPRQKARPYHNSKS